MSRKIVWLDTETTGVDDKVNAIIQLAGIISVDGVDAEEFNITMRPWEGAQITKEAMDTTGKTVDEIMTYQDPGSAISYFKRVLAKYVDKYNRQDKFVVAGYNVGFDTDIIRRAFEIVGDKYYGSWFFASNLDVRSYVAEYNLLTGKRPANQKLGTMCEECGIELNNAHDALADVRATRDLFMYLRQQLSELAWEAVTPAAQ